jgi:geranylgeranyl diphosphate synthase type II
MEIARLEDALRRALAGAGQGPPRLAQAIRYAVFPPGARWRPRLCYAVVEAVAGDPPASADAAAAAIELIHCASLAHDDLPCFDDAPTRRGRPALHRAFGEALAVLAGDALIVAAFGTLAAVDGALGPPLARVVARAAGAPHGIAAGQAWEAEPAADLARYHAAKTASLFEAASVSGAIVAGAEPEPWAAVGRGLGMAYQIVDDLEDASPGDRFCAVHVLGMDECRARSARLLAQAEAAIPPCRDPAAVRALFAEVGRRLARAGR